MRTLCRTILAAVGLSMSANVAFAAGAGAVQGDAARMGASAMNPGSRLGFVERLGGGDFKVLVYGNSIALHGPKPDIGWTNRWGMAASAPEKDFAHLVVSGLEAKLGKRADFRIRNLAVLERNFTTNISTVAEIAADAAWKPDYVVVAIGENSPNIDDSAAAYRMFLSDIARPFADAGSRVVMRSPFWRNDAKAACTKEAAQEVGAVYVDAGHLGAKAENKAIGLFSHSGVANHPGDLGMRRLADMILAGLAAEGLPSVASAAVNISTGRQLFVDDFLVDRATNVARRFNSPVKMDDPVVWPRGGAAPKTVDGTSGAEPGEPVNLTCATDGGLWWDPTKRKFRLWYQADWLGDICYAESDDGIRWEYPDLGIVPGTNRIFEHDVIDSWNVTPNYEAKNPYADWKLHISYPYVPPAWPPASDDRLWQSVDGIHFEELGLAGRSGDRSTSYYDPFRGLWVFSLRAASMPRTRLYFASRDFGGDECHWSAAGDKNCPESLRKFAPAEPWLAEVNKGNRQLYSFNAVAYESLMLGVMEILYNTPGDNGDCMKTGLPKQTALHFAFSRDGKTFSHREEADIAPSGWGSGKWDTGYLSPVGGICVVKGERLWFYYSGLRGDGTRLVKKPWQRNGMYSNGAIGIATLRRDGFAGMVADGMGEVLTKPVSFSGRHLFVNAECRFGSVCAEIVGDDGKPVPGFSRGDCAAFSNGDSTKTELRFKGGDLSALAGKPVRIRFLIRCGTLYSFWVSPSKRGESCGYVAGGGPDYPGLRDLR